jgi:signal transduction histidine kinase/ActR/RegA family two-component response regulator
MVTTTSSPGPRDAEVVWAFLEGLFRHAPVAIAFFDHHASCIRVNAALAARNGKPAADHIGRGVRDVIPSDYRDIERAIDAVLETGDSVHVSVPACTVDCYPVRVGGETVGIGVIIAGPQDGISDSRWRRSLERERAARSHAEQLNQSKDEFLAVLSHELRTPLNAIAGWTRLLQGEKLAPDERARALETILRGVKLQAALIEDLLDVSRIVAGKMRIQLERVALAGVATAAVEGARPNAAAKRVTLETRVAADVGEVLGDAHRLEQVIMNLLANAIKFTPAEGRVRLGVARAGGHVVIEVSDNGAGIRRELMSQIFDRFRQGDSSATRATGGLGLGLAIARHLVEAHGGTLHAVSDGQGKGSTFTVTLPAIATTREDVAPHGSSEGPLENGAITGAQVLVVDDDKDSRDLLVAVVSGAGGLALSAGSAGEALGILRRHRPDVIVCDLGMPEKDGFSFMRELRASGEDAGAWIPAIALTGYASAKDSQAALLAGFQMHLPKPVDPPVLIRSLIKLWRRGTRDNTP